MLSEFLKGNSNFIDKVSSWEESIVIASQPLIEKAYIELEYIQAMVENVRVNGSYIVIVPEIAMPHATTDKGVNKTSMSFLKLNEPVIFPGNHEVKLLFVLATEDNTTHLELLSDLSSILIEEEIKEMLKSAKNEEELVRVIKMVEE
ncbi:PTS sugar transporter subunit IIA [Carnobacterium sp. ISL-102]|uniref:PTS sugar transporter subunit IIA n=1 Tax=Carnobacterium sp. ISL-102 TaxID=2819142 RepID=UPI001BE570F6|nr:PTS sugar transporter subunit IIA [Carnobacterium sp. ISL-102]MBT2732214.1 PTS sugar transporter subunit IIA [Carnobacterium sp. ISL-102]